MARNPIWEPSGGRADGEFDLSDYGEFDDTAFDALELQMYQLVGAGRVTMTELKEVITLDEFLKLYALWRMEKDIESARADELREEAGQR